MSNNAKMMRVGIIKDNRIVTEGILGDPHRGGGQNVTVDLEGRTNFILLEVVQKRPFPFLKRHSDYFLHLTDKMSGKISKAGDTTGTSLEEFRQQTKPNEKGIWDFPLTPDMRGKINVGDVAVLFQFVLPPPKARRPKRR